MINFTSFRHTSEWQLIVEHLRQKEMDLVNEIISAGEKGDAFKIANIAGQIGAIREFAALPDYLYSINRGNQNAQEPD